MSGCHSAIKICHGPGCGGLIAFAARDEVQMEVLGPFAKGDCINAIAMCELFHYA